MSGGQKSSEQEFDEIRLVGKKLVSKSRSKSVENLSTCPTVQNWTSIFDSFKASGLLGRD